MNYKKIEGYENYMVSDTGLVLNIKRNKHLVNCISDRYRVVLLYKNNTRKMYYVHRLVAEAFCENPKGQKCVNHKDLNKENNHYTNLEWVSHKENTAHFIFSDKYKKRKWTENQKIKTKERLYKKVLCLETKQIFKSISDFSEYKNISLAQASQKLNSKYINNLYAILI